MPHNEKPGRARRHSRTGTGCESTLEQVETRREERKNSATPWILLKSMVLVVFGLIGFTAYTYIGRFLLPGLREEKDYPFSRSTCIGLLVGYCIVLLMFIWTYCRIIFTSPGYAVDHVAKTPSPTTMPEPATIPGYPYQPHIDVEAGPQANGHPSGGHTGPPYGKEAASVIRPDLQRRPNPTPVLRDEYRYCYREGFVKPKRTHHCRACGKCVLAYDHHCPWIGQCVGARNMRYFFVFLEWTLVYCVYVLVSLLFSVTRRGRDLDGAQIATIALAALFTLFMIGMMATHVRLIMINQTTVESMIRQGLREQERAVLDNELSCWDARSRRLIGKRWNSEWGNPDTEGNIWWLGSSSANWKARMGDNPLGWFLPLATHNPTGLDYDVNPRFDADGRWRRREEWPAEFR